MKYLQRNSSEINSMFVFILAEEIKQTFHREYANRLIKHWRLAAKVIITIIVMTIRIFF